LNEALAQVKENGYSRLYFMQRSLTISFMKLKMQSSQLC